ncbi:Delta-1-pyrroline-5-carboxylate dehydrogenase 12A1, mitochondrial, partial [Mucuna pruriens]
MNIDNYDDLLDTFLDYHYHEYLECGEKRDYEIDDDDCWKEEDELLAITESIITRKIYTSREKISLQGQYKEFLQRVTSRLLEKRTVRFLARSFAVTGNHLGQQSHGFRWPYGPVTIITPFNFPLEIPVLQLMGALYMGNKPVLKVDSKTMNKLLPEANPRMTLFTGSSRVAEKLVVDLKGRVKLKDAGFDWKILGPDVHQEDYIAWVCDQDAYACSGQKCSAQSLLFMHENWSKTSLLSKLKDLAERRKLEDLIIGPVLTVTTDSILEHVNKLLEIPGSKLLFGVDLWRIIQFHLFMDKNFELVTKNIRTIPDYYRLQEQSTISCIGCPGKNDVIGKSVNGTTYAGLRASTTGAPQNHWFGPAGDARGAGIGTLEAIKLVWSCHREIMYDLGPVPNNWEIPPST